MTIELIVMRFQLLLIALVLSVYSHQALSWGMKELGQEAASPLTTNAKYVLLGGTLVTASLALMARRLAGVPMM